MDLEARPVVTIGAKAPSLADVCRIACASIPPRLVLDPKAVARNDEHFINNFKADSQEAWQPVPRPKRQPTMPVTGNIGVGDASVEVVERAVVYATAVIRISTLMAPDSGVRMDFVQGLVDLLNDNKLPSLEATFHDRQALETFAERVYQRQIAEKSPPPNSSTSNGVRSVPGATLRSRSPQGGGSGGTLSQMMKNMKTDDPAKRSFEEEPSAPFVLSEPEAEVFCHGTAFSIARTLVAMQTSHACALFADCATALTVEACKLPLSFVDRSDTMGFAGGANGTSAPLAFPGGTQSVNHIYQLLEDSAVKRLADSEVDPEVMEALAAVPMYSGALTECIAPVQNLVRAEIACTSRRDLVLAAIAAAEDRERKAVDPYHQEQEKTKPSKSAGRAFLMPESRRVDTLRACVLSQVEVMNGLATALLNVVEGCMPKIKQAAAERGTQSALEESKGVDSALIPIDANPVNEESVERLEQRLSHLREQAFEINETEFKIGDSVAPTRGKIAGTLLLEVLALQICTALQLICHDEVRNFNDAVQKLNQNKKSVQKKLNLGKGVDKFKDFAIELIDCHCPPNKRDEMISASEVILHSALGRIGLAAPEITDQLEEILTPVNQARKQVLHASQQQPQATSSVDPPQPTAEPYEGFLAGTARVWRRWIPCTRTSTR